MIPGLENESVFIKSVNALIGEHFEYVSIHKQDSNYMTYNLNLYKDGKWQTPELTDYFFVDEPVRDDEFTNAYFLENEGPRSGLGSLDFLVSTQMRMNSRAAPSEITDILAIQEIDSEPKQVARVIKRLFDKNVLEPTIWVSGLDLMTNFMFEVVCNDKWNKRIKQRIPLLPWTNSLISSRGIIVTAQVPSYHQTEYYKLFGLLKEQKGVESFQPIMTISMRGGRLMSEIVRFYSDESESWSIPKEYLDLAGFVEEYLDESE
jgi:hypothetical protein